MQRWRTPGDEQTTTIPRLSSNENSFSAGIYGNIDATWLYNYSDATVVPGDYLRLRNVVLEYRLPQNVLKSLHLGSRQMGAISLKLQAQNLFVLKDRRLLGYDPETINYTTTPYGAQPLSKTFTLGVNINF